MIPNWFGIGAGGFAHGKFLRESARANERREKLSMTVPDPHIVGEPVPVQCDSALALLATVAGIIGRFGMVNLQPAAAVCSSLIAAQAPLDVAVLGQFKSGKSSLLNAIVGGELLPVGVVPVTAVITRLRAGAEVTARVTDLDGRVETIAAERVADFVTETLNPANRRRVALVDVATPAMNRWPNLRLVDTPGLGSTFGHNTQATKDWLPNVAAALIVVSADRPLSEDERALIAEVRQIAPRVWIVLSKIDLLGTEQQTEVVRYLRDRLRHSFLQDLAVLPFSVRQDRDRWLQQLQEEVFRPLIEAPARELHSVFVHKVRRLATVCGEYLQIARRTAVGVAADRERLRSAILGETVREDVIRDELLLTDQRMCAAARPAFDARFNDFFLPMQEKLIEQLRNAMPSWRGHLARQTCQFEQWLREHLTAELTTATAQAVPLACNLVIDAERRFHRVVEAFRDRLARNVSRELKLTISPVAWDVHMPAVLAPDTTVGKTFATNWELLWWAIPMPVFGWLFRRHCLGLVPWEVEKNLRRLVSDWNDVVAAAIHELREQALGWVRSELTTLRQLLERQADEVPGLEEILHRLETGLSSIGGAHPAG